MQYFLSSKLKGEVHQFYKLCLIVALGRPDGEKVSRFKHDKSAEIRGFIKSFIRCLIFIKVLLVFWSVEQLTEKWSIFSLSVKPNA